VAQGFFRPTGKLFSAADHGAAFEIDFVFVFVVEIVAVAVVVAGVVVVVGIKILRVDTSLSKCIMKENMAVFFPPVMGSPLFLLLLYHKDAGISSRFFIPFSFSFPLQSQYFLFYTFPSPHCFFSLFYLRSTQKDGRLR